jgi:hypothetical protein
MVEQLCLALIDMYVIWVVCDIDTHMYAVIHPLGIK